jgi:hypothetical protein
MSTPAYNVVAIHRKGNTPPVRRRLGCDSHLT